MNTKESKKYVISPKNNAVAKTFAHPDKPQPTPEQKKAGWAKKKNMAYWIDQYLKTPYEEFLKIREEIAKKPKKYTMVQVAAMAYVHKLIKNERVMFDNLDRTEGKPIQKNIIEIKDQNLIEETIEKINKILNDS